MGLIKGLVGFSRKSAGTATATPTPAQTFTAHETRALVDKIRGMNPGALYYKQPSVHSAVDFIAGSVAGLKLQTFERVSDTDRRTASDSNTAKLLANPNPGLTSFELNLWLASDYTLYKRAYWFFGETRDGWTIVPLVVPAVSIKSGTEAGGDLVITYTGGAKSQTILQKNLIIFKGWNPEHSTEHASPAVLSLRNTLAEHAAAEDHRIANYRNGAQVSQFINRPTAWAPEARKKWMESFTEWRQSGAKQGAAFLLEENMTITNSTPFNSREAQWFEAAQLTDEVVARAFKTSPDVLSGKNPAALTAFYNEVVGPLLAQFESTINTRLTPVLDPGKNIYVAYNLKAKLDGDFLTRGAVMSTATGRPWITANEARRMDNLPPINDPDADSLVTPLNVLIGGQASPRDSAPPKSAGQVAVKADATAAEPVTATADSVSEKALQQVIDRFFARQSVEVLKQLSTKADGEWFDTARWDKELGDDLYKAAVLITSQIGSDAAAALGFTASEYGVDQTLAFLKAVAASRATWINATTLAALEAVRAEPEPEDDSPRRTPETVFEEAKTSRGEQISRTVLTTLGAFALTEAAKQLAGDRATKTWHTNSTDPRSAHKSMDGKSARIGEPFSNGAQWPGDPSLDAEGVANCKCSVSIYVPR
ncbi:phage portal protein [Cryobacterium sp. SO1]|uniref:phage portal protein n=1 Tax=Cryobacterium sp. SO1 TaxID=1897061 RepID=UPI00102347C8|nr:phage portal protein [Cryobacterium sp. SO1]RZI35324.1 hypothetical protein BJQ95_02391 [Cryobacterium sp. SO1]